MQLILFASQYLVLALLYLFLFQVIAALRQDLRDEQPEEPRAKSVQKQPQLVVVRGDSPKTGERFLITSSSITLGRATDNQVVIGDLYASKHHARATWTRGQCWLEDLSSSNGTVVNGKRIAEPVPLKAGDRIEIGDTVFVVEF